MIILFVWRGVGAAWRAMYAKKEMDINELIFKFLFLDNKVVHKVRKKPIKSDETIIVIDDE